MNLLLCHFHLFSLFLGTMFSLKNNSRQSQNTRSCSCYGCKNSTKMWWACSTLNIDCCMCPLNIIQHFFWGGHPFEPNVSTHLSHHQNSMCCTSPLNEDRLLYICSSMEKQKQSTSNAVKISDCLLVVIKWLLFISVFAI